jgi:Domain of unknown function (DUF4405)
MRKSNLISKKNPIAVFLINLGLLLAGSTMIFSGILIQFGYHHGHHGKIDTSHSVLGLNYFNWADFHKISIILVSIGMVFHIIRHWKWYKTVLRKKKLIAKNRQAITLTTVFIFVAITGYLSWFIKLSGGSDWSPKFFIEIHDKITWVLFLYLILHVSKKFKWFLITFERVKNKWKNQPALGTMSRSWKGGGMA